MNEFHGQFKNGKMILCTPPRSPPLPPAPPRPPPPCTSEKWRQLISQGRRDLHAFIKHEALASCNGRDDTPTIILCTILQFQADLYQSSIEITN